MVWIIGVLAVIALAGVLFVKLYPGIADFSASAEDRADYSARAANYDGSAFQNEHDFQMMQRVVEGAVDGIVSTKGTTPQESIPTMTPTWKTDPAEDELSFTWLGHSSLLIQMHGMNILFDPVFSEYASPVSFTGNKRFSDVPMAMEDIPEIDILILTHDHYDHLDRSTITALDSRVKQYIVPLGVEYRLMRFGVSREKITNMAWWEELDINGLTVACTPARHYTGRYIIDAGKTLWASFVLKHEYHQVFESGDTGYDTHFEDIHNKYGDFDLVFMEGAQYSLHWPSLHMNPEEAGAAVRTLGAEYVVPIHWGTFRLANHPWDDSVVRLVLALDGSGVPVITPQIGETVTLEGIDQFQTRWYETIQ